MSSYHHFYQNLDRLARTELPSLKSLDALGWEYLISPLEINLPKSVWNQASQAIAAFHNVSRRPSYTDLLEDAHGLNSLDVKNNAVLMAYDFHTNEQGDCFLVEINTNASGFMFSSLLNLAHTQGGFKDFAPLKDLHESFVADAKLSGTSISRLAITDEDIPAQKMYPEFLMYRDWFRSCGWDAELVEANAFVTKGDELFSADGKKFDFVYNRLTDFYLESATSASLKQIYGRGNTCLSPHPKEYWRLADKQRLIQFSQPEFLQKAQASPSESQAIQKVVLPSFEKSHFASEDEIWEQRRNLFFKPKRSYGGKSVYRGESVSRKVFDRLMKEEILIQRFQPAQRVPTDDPRSVLNNWKFDLRCFAYADRVQMAVARIYQGQVTNFSSPLGGFTKVNFI